MRYSKKIVLRDRTECLLRNATKEDTRILAELAMELWDSHEEQELEMEFLELIESSEAKCFLIYQGEKVAGFAQCQLRHDYVEGTHSSPVGYLEGIYVREQYQHQGMAKELLRACENWAKTLGCKEFASDCELDNTDSLKFHRAMEFEEANRIICFRKEL